MGVDPFTVLQSLASKFDFFTFDKQTDEKTVTATLKFKEMNDVVMVEFPDNFLNLSDQHDSLAFKLTLSAPNYDITDKDKTAMKDAYPLGKHLKQGTKSTTTAFFMTDGAEIQLTRSTSAKPPKDYVVNNFELKVYHAKQPLRQMPYHQTFRIPRGNYSLESFISTMKQSFGNQSLFKFDVNETRDVVRKITTVREGGDAAKGRKRKAESDSSGGEKRTKLMDSKEYKSTLKLLIPGYRITIDPRLQSILAFDRHIQTGYDVQTSERPILLSSFTYNLMLYCRFIKQNIQGGQFESVLRTIPFPTQKRRGETIMMEFEHIQFHKLDVTSLEDLSFEIRDDTGKIVQFKDGRTMLKLMFIHPPS